MFQIFDEKLNYNVGPKIDTNNPNYVKHGGNVQV